MRVRVSLACSLLLIAGVVGFSLMPPETARAKPAILPCADPRGCPDLSVVESKLRLAHIEQGTFSPTSCAVVEGMTQAGTRDLLVFPYETPNTGQGALNLGDPADHSRLFEFAECHNHLHFKEYADYRLWTPGGYAQWKALRAGNPQALASDLLDAHPELRSELVESAKRGFCVIDYKRAAQFSGGRDPRTYTSCLTNQGISVGWADEYVSRLDGQWIDVTDVPAGDYVLDVEANAERVFGESSYTNNSAAVPVKVRHGRG